MSPERPHRYCQKCGARFALEADARSCGECGARWNPPAEPRDLGSLAALLNRIEDWRDAGLLVPNSYRLLRQRYEARLQAVRPPRAAATSPTPAAAQPATPPRATTPSAQPSPAPQVRERSPRKPPRPPTVDLTRWAAERQADILLYLGAFLLVIAAVIFVNYQGEEFPAEIRVAVLAVYTAAFVAAGLLVRRWERVREAGPVFLLIGALFTPLNFVLLDVELLDRRGVPNDVIWLAGSGYSGLFYSILMARGYGRIYALPAIPALLIAWGALASVVNLPAEWGGAWYLALTVALTSVAANRGWLSRAAVIGVAILAIASAAGALLFAAYADAHEAQLPVTLLLLTAWLAVLGEAKRQPWLLPAAATAATAAAVAALWAAAVGAEWYVYPLLVTAALAVASRELWAHWDRAVASFGWSYAAMLALSPLALFFAAVEESWHGAASHLGAAAIFAAIAWRNSEGQLARDVFATETPRAALIERVLFGWSAFGLLLVAVALAQQSAGVERPETGWAYLAIALVVGAALAALGRRQRWVPGALFPPFAVAVAVSLQPWGSAAGHDALLLGAPAVPMALAFATTRRYSLASAATVLGAAAAAAAWSALEWPTWTLAVTYGSAGAAALLGLSSLRRYESLAAAPGPARLERPLSAGRDAWVLALSWGLSLAAPITAAVALAARVEAAPSAIAVETVEYRALVFLALALAPLIAFEGWRLRNWHVTTLAAGWTAAVAYAIWPAFDWSLWTLALTFTALGAVGFAVLTPLRHYALDEDLAQRSIAALSWGPLLLGPATAAIALMQRLNAAPSIVAVETVEYRAMVLLALALAPLIAFEGWRLRNWHVTALATGWAAAVAYAIWPAFAWPVWTLAITFMALGLARFAVLTPLRRYAFDADLAQRSIAALSWGPLLLGPATAAIALTQRLDAEPSTVAAETVEYRLLAVLILLLAPPILFEARRFREWNAAALGLAPVALAMALAWPVFGWPAWTLGAAYWAGGTALFVALAPRRTYDGGREQPGIFLLSWPLLAAGIAATFVGVTQRANTPGIEVDQTIEYAAFAALTLLSVAHVAFEARRLRNWNFAAGAGVLAGIGLGIVWPALDWPVWSLALAYAGLGGVLLVALTPYREYAAERQNPAVLSLSWGFPVLALLVAYSATSDVAPELLDAVRSAEYYTLTALVLAGAAAVAYEGWRLRERRVLLGASALAMGSVLMAIAIARPENVQAYTAPSAAYLLALGAIVRRSPSVIERHLALHEIATIAGALMLVLPQAEQSFDPGGAWWGFVLLIESAAFVTTAFLLRIRWLAVCGVLTASGVGIRWLAESGDTIPYWATLGLGGMLLIGAGTSLLLNREWWDRTARQTVDWWERSPLRA